MPLCRCMPIPLSSLSSLSTGQTIEPHASWLTVNWLLAVTRAPPMIERRRFKSAAALLMLWLCDGTLSSFIKLSN